MTSVRAEVEELLARYAWAYDEDDPSALAACFTEDAVFDYGSEVLTGRDAILERLTGNRAAARERGEQPRHVMTNIVVDELPGGGARARSYLAFTVTSPAGAALVLTATYEDEAAHEGGAWRFRRRKVRRDTAS